MCIFDILLQNFKSNFYFETASGPLAVDEVCDSRKCPAGKVTPILERALVLPLEGKGDRVSGG